MKFTPSFTPPVKIGRNDPCPCGSGAKYKKCCLIGAKPSVKPETTKELYFRKYEIRLKSPEDIIGMKKSGRLVLDTLNLVESKLCAGMTTEEIDNIVYEFTIKNGGHPAPLHYKGYPKSTCISVNEEICHGVPGKRVLKDGDIVNVDITTILNGYYADANKTFSIGTPGPDALKIMRVSLECLREGIKMVRPGNTIGDIGWAIQRCAETQGCSVVRQYVGHGIGFEFHEAPQMPHFGKRRDGIVLVPGMTFTIEPMINLGTSELYVLDDKWTAVTKDGKLSAQFEQTVLVTETGYESITPY